MGTQGPTAGSVTTDAETAGEAVAAATAEAVETTSQRGKRNEAQSRATRVCDLGYYPADNVTRSAAETAPVCVRVVAPVALVSPELIAPRLRIRRSPLALTLSLSARVPAPRVDGSG